MRVRGTNYLFISDFFFEFLLSLIFVFFFRLNRFWSILYEVIMLHLTSKGSHNRSKGDKSNERSEYSHIGFGDFFRKKLLR